MMKTHVKLMQKQLQDGFGLIANKMGHLEGKLNDNDKQIKNIAQSKQHDNEEKERVNQENKKLFQRLQESIAAQ